MLLDVNLPDTPGLDVLREIRATEGVTGRYDPELPVLDPVESGRSIRQVQKLLGHHAPSFTLDTYIHLMDEGIGAALDLDAELGAGEAARVGAGADREAVFRGSCSPVGGPSRPSQPGLALLVQSG